MRKPTPLGGEGAQARPPESLQHLGCCVSELNPPTLYRWVPASAHPIVPSSLGSQEGCVHWPTPIGFTKDMDAKLKVNGYPIGIGSTRNSVESAGFRSLGLLLRLSLSGFLAKWGRYNKCAMWVKNPELIFFDDFITRSKGNDPAATSLEAIFGTSVFAILRDDAVVRLHVQLFRSVTYARGLANDFRRNAFEMLGTCRSSKPILIPRYLNDCQGGRDSLLSAWQDRSGYLICELSPAGDSCFIHAGIGEWPLVIERGLTSRAATMDDLSDTSSFSQSSFGL